MRGFFYHLFIPHHTNNYRARVLHVDVLCFYLVAVFFFHTALSFIHRIAPDVLGYAIDMSVEQLLSVTNEKRGAIGLAPLQFNSALSNAASQKAADMFAKNYWAHTSSEGSTPWQFITSSGYEYRFAGENLAKNFLRSPDVVEAWMASPTHRDNILKQEYRDVGFAIVNGVLEGEETTLIVQMFGTPYIESPAQGEKAIVIPEKALATVVNSETVKETKTAGTELSLPKTEESQPLLVRTQQVVNGQFINSLGEQSALSLFAKVYRNPLINIFSLEKHLVMFTLGFIFTILAVDLWVVNRKKIARVSGHTVAHSIFILMIIIILQTVKFGSIL